MNISPERRPIPTHSEPSYIEQVSMRLVWGFSAILVICFLAWASQFADPVWQFLKALA